MNCPHCNSSKLTTSCDICGESWESSENINLVHECDELRTLLRDLEWVYPWAGPPFCQECRREEKYGHAPDCRIDAALRKGKNP